MALQLVYLVTLFLLFQQRTSEGSLKPRTLSSTRLKRAAESTDYDEFAGLLDPILRSRIPGTKGHHFVKEYIITFFQNLGWSVSTDQFDQDTVIGPKRFTNIIATSNPGAEKFLLLTAHYDSKMITQNGIQQDFVAATDSAVPCAMMMSVAKNLDLNELKKNKYGLEMVFFDGEEAFKEWSKNDSLYGSQHLAKIWSNPNASGKTHVSSIEAFILLDLIGAKNPKFYSSYATTHWMFERLQRIETRLRSVGLIKGSPFYFNGNGPVELGIEDDHIPFAERGVPILHLISVPFPTCWHQLCDNRQNIDQDTVHDLLKIFQIFFREMMRV